MKKPCALFLGIFVAFVFAGNSIAALEVIGTASYLGADYNLIYEHESIYGGLIWLDYSNPDDLWQNQVNWASDLGKNISVTLYPGYSTSIEWDIGWRLPVVDESKANLTRDGTWYEGPDASGYHDYATGYNMVNSEMGHLFYESLGNLGRIATDGTHRQEGDYGLQNDEPFNNLAVFYWTGTEYSLNPSAAWNFSLDSGLQYAVGKDGTRYAIAVHPGTVTLAPVPIPGTLWLLGSGLMAFAGLRKKAREPMP